MNKHFFRALFRDSANRLRYGSEAPVYGEKIYVKAGDCHTFIPSSALERHVGQRLRQASATVVETWPHDDELPLDQHPKIRVCLRHWVQGLGWEEAGAYQYMMERIREEATGNFDGCRSLDDVKARYKRLDEVFSHLQDGGDYLAMAQLGSSGFREVGGVMFHIGPKGEPVFAGAGAHRLSMAISLGLTIPAQIGLVHRHAIPMLRQYRS